MRNLLTTLVMVVALVSGVAAQKSKIPAKVTPPATAAAAAKSPVADAALKSVKARAIGPAVMGGRISDIAFDPKNPFTFYVATAHGGLMKTTDSGATFSALTDD